MHLASFLGRHRRALGIALLLLLVAGSLGWRMMQRWIGSNSISSISLWFAVPASRPALTTRLTEPCPGAPFLLPSSGLIGLLYADPAPPYTPLRRHSGIDIFGDGAPGTVPVVAAYPGELYRMSAWRSAVIIRHDDPLVPGRTLWTYYTHMASRDGTASFIHPDFPPGIAGVPVEQGRLLGYQGEYGGTQQIGLHLHFSIVLSDSGGSYLNETQLANTVDPTPYLGIPLNINAAPPRPVNCTQPPP